MGMGHLLGQLGLPISHDIALPLLLRAATLASLDVPHPAYVFALILFGEFTLAPSISPSLLTSILPSPSTSTSTTTNTTTTTTAPAALEARRHLERAAYLHYPAAQYKVGHAYEFAQPPFPFDPLLSVQYYSLASQQGEVEADMALSKWFLCGSSGGPGSGSGSGSGAGVGVGVGVGGFEKDEGLAWTFADKAARKGLPSAEFAMGYYAEVGVGGPKDVQMAIKWYTRVCSILLQIYIYIYIYNGS